MSAYSQTRFIKQLVGELLVKTLASLDLMCGRQTLFFATVINVHIDEISIMPLISPQTVISMQLQ